MMPAILHENVPHHMLAKFKRAKLPAVKWEHLIFEAVFYRDNDKEEDKLSQVLLGDDKLGESDGEAEEEDGSTIGSIMDDGEVNKVEIDSIKELGGKACPRQIGPTYALGP
jgi:hypothetical protein